ncbi:lantibiotic dehydratase [Nocardia sp. NPDC055053]
MRATDLLLSAGLEDWSLRWNKAAQDYLSRLAPVAASESDALSAARSTVHAAFADERIRHAVFVSNPDFHDHAAAVWDRDPTEVLNGSARRTLATLHRYLRRFSTRCETVSFFGPVQFIELDGAATEPLAIDEPGSERIIVEASSWLVEALTSHLTAAADPADRSIRRNPLFAELPGGHGLRHAANGRKFRVDAPRLALWRAADGRTAVETAEALGWTVDEVLATASSLGGAVSILAHPTPSVELHALTRLARMSDDPVVAGLAAARDRYATTAWPQRRAVLRDARRLAGELADGSTRRQEGSHYADREIFHEDRTGPHSERIRIGGPALEGMGDALGSVLPICYLGALLRRADARAALREALGGKATPLAELTSLTLPTEGPAMREFRDRLESAFARSSDVRSGELHVALADLWSSVPHDAAADVCFPSPDLMALGPELSTTPWLLAELHDDCSSIYGGLESPLHTDPGRLWREFAADVAASVGDQGATIVGRRRSAHVTPELPGVSIELAGRSSKEESEIVPIAEAVVAPEGDAVLVRGQRRRLYPGDLNATLYCALALPSVVPVPVGSGVHTPRLSIDGTVYQRERWRCRVPESGNALDLHRLRRRLGLPRRVFVRYPAEPKPLYLDFADPLSLREAARHAGAEVSVTEMLPASDSLWWPLRDPQCAELRIGCSITPVEKESK